MCLAVPGRVVAWIDRQPHFASAAVEFGGVRRQVNMAFVPEAELGDYVLVHAGIAISRLDADEAAKVFEVLHEVARAGQEDPPLLADQPGEAE